MLARKSVSRSSRRNRPVGLETLESRLQMAGDALSVPLLRTVPIADAPTPAAEISTQSDLAEANHTGGAHFVFADGSVRFIRDSIDIAATDGTAKTESVDVVHTATITYTGLE